mmetsp:Transcript_10919/g.40391  ORF Transcript_10919/g.40391 Transcript_10919/m.40391 type:complete len:265 (-) Transcript_10919:1371-2165(-)
MRADTPVAPSDRDRGKRVSCRNITAAISRRDIQKRKRRDHRGCGGGVRRRLTQAHRVVKPHGDVHERAAAAAAAALASSLGRGEGHPPPQTTLPQRYEFPFPRRTYTNPLRPGNSTRVAIPLRGVPPPPRRVHSHHAPVLQTNRQAGEGLALRVVAVRFRRSEVVHRTPRQPCCFRLRQTAPQHGRVANVGTACRARQSRARHVRVVTAAAATVGLGQVQNPNASVAARHRDSSWVFRVQRTVVREPAQTCDLPHLSTRLHVPT